MPSVGFDDDIRHYFFFSSNAQLNVYHLLRSGTRLQ